MTDIIKLRIAMECAEDEWQAAVRHALKGPTPAVRVEFDIKAENLFNKFWIAKKAYIAAVKEAAAEQELHDPQGVQNHTLAAEFIRS